MTAIADRTGGRAVETAAVVQVLGVDGLPVGAGCLIGPDVVATCAHVVAAALLASNRGPAPAESVVVQFPLVAGEQRNGVVVSWSPINDDGSGDVALLRLDRPAPAGVWMPPVRRIDDLWGHRFRVLGFPDGLADGAWSTGRFRGEQGTGWFQLQADHGEPVIAPGFSGSPVWDVDHHAVVGLVVATDDVSGGVTAYLIPIAEVLGLDPELLPCPYRGLEVFEEEHSRYFYGRDALIDRVLETFAGRAFIAITGGSGSGKSSLLRAGVIPRLRQRGHAVHLHRALIGESADQQLAGALEHLGLDAPTLPRQRTSAAPWPNRVLVIDQLEELAETDPTTAVELLSRISELTADPANALQVLATLRWETLSTLVTPTLATLINAGAVLVPAMSRDEMRRAVVAPAEHAPGLTFEEGLVDAILDDAGSEPGALALVESLLEQLWHRRLGGMLTFAAYREAHGVSGAIAARAEEVVVTLDPAGHSTLQRLMTKLARSSAEGRFVRNPAQWADLTPAEQHTVQLLAGARLVVTGPSMAGQTTVELAHQALIDHWPRLRGWLAADRDFITWRADTDEVCRRWRESGQDSGSLLRGSALATAQEFLAGRRDEIGPHLLRFLELSVDRRRRDVRQWQAAVAVLLVLLVVSTILSVVSTRRGERLSAELATAAANQLSAAAMARAVNDPTGATQLALAAWRADPSNVQARSALLDRYLSNRSVSSVLSGVTASTITQMTTSSDGRTALLTTEDGASVVPNLGGDGTTQAWSMDLPKGSKSRMAPGGGTAVSLTPDGRYLLWNLSTHSNVEIFRSAPASSTIELAAEFSSNSRYLAILTATSANTQSLTVWDVAAPKPLQIHVVALPYPRFDTPSARITDDGNTLVVLARHFDEAKFATTNALDVWDLGTGQSQRLTGPAETGVSADGSKLYNLRNGDYGADGGTPSGIVTITDRAGGRQREVFVPGSGTVDTSLIGDRDHVFTRSAVGLNPGAVRTADRGHVTSLRTGKTADLTVPVIPENLPTADKMVSWPEADPLLTATDHPDGSMTVLAARGTALYTLRTTPDWLAASPTIPHGALLSDDRSIIVNYERGKFVAHDASTGRPLGSMAPDPRQSSDFGLQDIDLDSAMGRGYRDERSDVMNYQEWTLPGFRTQGPISLPSNPDFGPPASAFAVTTPDRIYSLVGAGKMFAVFDRATGQMIGEPTVIGSSTTPTADPKPSGVLVLHPSDPDLLVTTSIDTRLVLWDAAARREVVTLPVTPTLNGSGEHVRFSPAGDRLYVVDQTNHLVTLDTHTWRPVGASFPVKNDTDIVGATDDGFVMLRDSIEKSSIQFWDANSGAAAGTIPGVLGWEPANIPDDGGHHVTFDSGDAMPFTLPVNAQGWFDELCRTNARPLTPNEAAQYPAGVDPATPCPGVR